MPLTTVRQEVAGRFAEVQAFLTTIKNDEVPFLPQSQDLNTKKGLFLVLLYSAHEYALNRAVVEFAEAVNTTGVKYEHIHRSLYALTLEPQLKSCAMVGRESRWQRRIELFQKQGSGDIAKVFESVFLEELENVWAKTVKKTYAVLGIKDNALYHPKVKQYLDEVVERRNAVAHGRESAATVGQAYTSGRLQILHDEISTQVQYMILCFEQHLDGKHFIEADHKHAY